jgi:hypothetical protein
MKHFLIFTSLVLFATPVLSQSKVDTSNYYQHYSRGVGLKGTKLMTTWLGEVEVSQIVSEEMDRAGYQIIRPNEIIRVDTGKFVVAICYSEQSKFGFVYEGTHGIIFNNKDRFIKSNYKRMTGYDYSQKIVNLDGSSEFIKIKALPNNLFLIKEDLYWYQETDNPKDSKALISKEAIVDILRQDIRYMLSLAPKP